MRYYLINNVIVTNWCFKTIYLFRIFRFFFSSNFRIGMVMVLSYSSFSIYIYSKIEKKNNKEKEK